MNRQIHFFSLVCWVVLCLQIAVARIHANPELISELATVDKDDPDNVISLLEKVPDSGSLSEILGMLYNIGRSSERDEAERRWAGIVLTNIFAGVADYSTIAHLDKRDWDAILDNFLINGYLNAGETLDEKEPWIILMYQRPSPPIKRFIEILAIERPSNLPVRRPGQM